jgi:hypothetical protein
LLGDENARSVRDRVVEDVAKTEMPVDDFEQGVQERRAGVCTKYAALLLLTSKPSRGARAALEVAGAICA